MIPCDPYVPKLIIGDQVTGLELIPLHGCVLIQPLPNRPMASEKLLGHDQTLTKQRIGGR